MVLLGVLCLTASNAFLVWIPILVRQTLDAVEQLQKEGVGAGASVWDILLSSEAGWVIAQGVLWLTVANVLYGVLLFLTRQTLIVTSRKIEFDMRNEVYSVLQKLPQRFYAQNRTGDVYVRATEDIARVREYFGPAFMYGVNTITRAGIIITIMFMVNTELTIWALLPLPLLSVIAYWMSSFIHTRSNEIQEQYAVLAGRAQEAFSSIRLVKAFSREAYEKGRFDSESEQYRLKKLKLDIVESLFHPTLNFLVGASIVLVVWKGGLLVMDGVVSVGNIAEFIINVLFLTWPIAALGYTLNLVQRSAASNIRIQTLLNEPRQDDATTQHAGSQQDVFFRKEIRFDKVSFTYPGADSPALSDITLRIPAGKKIAIVGRTGAGKTTLVQLITRMFEPDSGQIFLDDRPIHSIPLDQLRALIGFVPQETFLFSETIRNNIAFGKENATFTDVEIAAKGAAVYENIIEFDKKFDTVLGERGITLSGGQKQRTSIARSLIRNPNILILDDALSAIDTKTENQIEQYLSEHLAETTVIQISHRIQSVKNADFIYVLKDGKLAEQGNHNELIDRNGPYASMYNKQMLEKELAEL
jgi:ATP-binding cassette, subfamily B, multidrug efflux pump